MKINKITTTFMITTLSFGLLAFNFYNKSEQLSEQNKELTNKVAEAKKQNIYLLSKIAKLKPKATPNQRQVRNVKPQNKLRNTLAKNSRDDKKQRMNAYYQQKKQSLSNNPAK